MADDAPASIPWYKSAVLRGMLVAIFTQVLARIAAKYHIDLAQLTALGINADALTQMTLDAIAAAALAYAAHGRVTKPNPPITLTKGQSNAPPSPPAIP